MKNISHKNKSVMKHQFSQVPSADIPRSVFNRTHGHKTTFDSGYLVPFYVDEALPGDTFNVNATLFSRLSTPIVPIMDNLYMDTFYFAVPLRLVWDNFQKMMGEQDNPEDSTDFLVPQITPPVGGFTAQSLEDYFGLPVGIEGFSVSSLWHRCYNLIYKEWFRDQNLQDSPVVDKGDGPDDPVNYKLLRRGKRHDYFTSGLPWPQKGPGVELPLGDSAPIVFTDAHRPYASGVQDVANQGQVVDAAVGGASTNFYLYGDDQTGLGINTYTGIETDLSSATAATINSLRTAFQMQKLLERDARGGTRYTEIVRSHFSVVSPDSRLQRPEYLGGSSSPVTMNPVAQTTQTLEQGTPQATLAAYSTSESFGNGFSKSFVEHSIIIGLVSVRADLTYQQGIPRMFSRKSRFDFYWPTLSHLGEQNIYNREIYVSGDPLIDDATFAYQERFAEYRYFPSKITGKFRSTDPQTLDVWHLSQEFADTPTLSASFIEENPPVDRIVAVPSEPQFIFDSYIEIRSARPMPTYSVPGLIDHF